MNPVISFLASSAGRVVRIAAGLALVLWGVLGLTGISSIVVAIVGLVPLAAGIFDFCVFAPVFGAAVSGAKIRAGR